MPLISRDDLRAVLDAGAVNLVEALPEPHYDAEHLPGAANMSGELSAVLAARLAPDRAAAVVTSCAGPLCGRFKVAAAGFIRVGYADVCVCRGGTADWAEIGLLFEGAHAAPKVV